MSTEKNGINLNIYASTFNSFSEKFKSGDRYAYTALSMYLFLYKTCIYQSAKFGKNINSVWATQSYIQNALGIKDRAYFGAKTTLIEMGLITKPKRDPKSMKSFFYVFVDKDTLSKEVLNYVDNKKVDLTKRQFDKTSTGSTDTNLSINTDTDLKNIIKDNKPSTSKKVLKKKVKLSKIIAKKKVAPKIAKKDKKPPVDLSSLSTDPYQKPKRVAKYKYNMADGQLYRSLLALGATEHKKNKEGLFSNAYYNTMDSIHEILDTSLPNPYFHSNNITDEIKVKKWEQEEVIDAFKYYMSIVDKSKIMYKSVATFIFASYNGTRSWSPLVKFFTEMNQDNGTTLEGDAKRFHSELERLHIGNYFDAKSINRMIRLMDVICAGYVPNPNFKHIYFDNIIFAFTEYIEPKLRINTFKPGYIQSEKFIQQFFDEYCTREILVQER